MTAINVLISEYMFTDDEPQDDAAGRDAVAEMQEDADAEAEAKRLTPPMF